MPMSGNTYVAPTWVDNAPPAISASELQAMCNTIAENQGDIASLNTAVAGKTNMQIVSYVGTGTYGQSNPCSVTASFPIKVAVYLGLVPSGAGSLTVLSLTGSQIDRIPAEVLTTSYVEGIGFGTDGSGYLSGKISSDQRTISWYHSSNYANQLNNTGATFYFALFG